MFLRSPRSTSRPNATLSECTGAYPTRQLIFESSLCVTFLPSITTLQPLRQYLPESNSESPSLPESYLPTRRFIPEEKLYLPALNGTLTIPSGRLKLNCISQAVISIIIPVIRYIGVHTKRNADVRRAFTAFFHLFLTYDINYREFHIGYE